MSEQTVIQHQPLRALPAGLSGLVKAVTRLIRNLRLITREFDDPLRALLVGLTANGIELDVDDLRLLKPLDGAFRNQCLALLIAVPGFNVKKAVELPPLDEPLRTHALVLLASTPTLDIETVSAGVSLSGRVRRRGRCVPARTVSGADQSDARILHARDVCDGVDGTPDWRRELRDRGTSSPRLGRPATAAGRLVSPRRFSRRRHAAHTRWRIPPKDCWMPESCCMKNGTDRPFLDVQC